jgi:hypothetical protein
MSPAPNVGVYGVEIRTITLRRRLPADTGIAGKKRDPGGLRACEQQHSNDHDL